MAFKFVETAFFRNIENGIIDTDSSSVFVMGENGQGKTNFLDAIYTLCYGSSFRTSQDSEVAKIGQKKWSIRGKNTNGITTSIVWQNSKKIIKEDDKQIYDKKQLVKKNPAIVFCHNDMDFASGEPERRRFFFDQTASLISISYIDTLRNYKKILKMRNIALKENNSKLLDVLDIQLVKYGIELSMERGQLIQSFTECFAHRYEYVSQLGFRINLEYKASWDELDTELITNKLLSLRPRELILGSSLTGPHRDRFVFITDDGDFSNIASIGQLRLLSLTLRIVQAEYFTLMTKQKPILLLDDVLLELDPNKRRRFMESLPVSEQSFFTFLTGEPYNDYIINDTIQYWTNNGKFTRT